MKTVFTDISTIAHMWANQTQDSARNSGNFYYNGNTIYSYGSHFPIAKHTVNDNDERGVLFTERTYSVTTSGHLNVVRQAVRHLNVIYCYSPESSHNENFNYWKRSIETIAQSLLKAKKPEIYLSQIDSVKDKATKYAAFFGIEIPLLLQAAFNITGKEQYSNYAANKEAILKAEAIQQKKELAAKHKKELAKWIKGQTNRLYTHNGFDYLRLTDNRIETSQAVKIPMELGKRIYQSIKDNSLAVGSKIMDYTVNETGKIVKVGCHTFKTDYLLKFGQSIFN